MTPEEIAKSGTEHAQQCALFAWVALNKDKYPQLQWMFAVKNAEKGGVIRGSMAKAEGVKSGVSDIFLPYSSRGYHGLFIEMKKKIKGKESDNQAKFRYAVTKNGFACIVCNGWIDARRVILSYLQED